MRLNNGEIMTSKMEIERICRFCGAHFKAQKTTTAYCTHKCASAAYKDRKRKSRIEAAKNLITPKESLTQISVEILCKPFLTPTEVSILLGIGRSTIYRYLQNNELKAVQLKGKTLIRRSDIEAMFDNSNSYRARPTKETKPITDFYTTAEIKEKYGITESWIFKTAKEKNIPKTLNHGKSYFSKKHIDQHFTHRQIDNSIKEWLTVIEIKEQYNLSQAAIYSFTSENSIPRKKAGKTVYYSKYHFDVAKGLLKPKETEYYSVEEAMHKYKFTRDMVYHYVKYHNIHKTKVGRYIKISKTELDKLFEEPTIL